MIRSGRRFSTSLRASHEWAGPAATIVGSSRPCCGGDEPVCRGEIYRRNSGRGRPCSTGSTDGRRRGDGADCSKRFASEQTTNGIASTALRIAPTSTLRAEKGGPGPRDRALSRWSDHEGSPRRRCARAAAVVPDHRRTAARPCSCTRAGARHQAALPTGR